MGLSVPVPKVAALILWVSSYDTLDPPDRR